MVWACGLELRFCLPQKFYGVVKSANPDVDGRGYERGTSFFYDCCEAREHSAEGCAFAPHKTYDEE